MGLAVGGRTGLENARILIVKLTSLGDVVHTLPAVMALRQFVPTAHLSWLIDDRFADVIREHSAVDETIAAKSWQKLGRWPLSSYTRPAVQFGIARSLRVHRYDAVIDFQGLFRTGLLSLLAGSSRRIGFAQSRELAPAFYTETHSVSTKLHAVDRNLQLVEQLVGDKVMSPDFGLHASAESRAKANLILESLGIRPSDRLAILAPRASQRGKEWPAERFVSVARRLWDQQGVRSLILGSSLDQSVCESISESVGQSSAVVVGRSLREVIAIMERCELFLGNDSGPLHLAVALGLPLVALYGPTSPVRTGPWLREGDVIQQTASCRACQWKLGRFARSLNIHSCLRTLPLNVVVDRLESLLTKIPLPAPLRINDVA